jgi:hypothetical protein
MKLEVEITIELFDRQAYCGIHGNNRKSGYRSSCNCHLNRSISRVGGLLSPKGSIHTSHSNAAVAGEKQQGDRRECDNRRPLSSCLPLTTKFEAACDSGY